MLHGAGLHAPRVLASRTPVQGFLLLTDLGSRTVPATLADAARRLARRPLMRDAIAALVQWQLRVAGERPAAYDDALLRRELDLFPEWCVQREYGIEWTGRAAGGWQAGLRRPWWPVRWRSPRVAVHRDWMPRNLMVAGANPGILDFQDAVRGPITYDIASLLRDAFISWDEEREIDWAVRWWQQARGGRAAGDHPMAADFGEFWRAARMDGPAAPPEGAGHLLPPQAPRRQAELQRRTCRASSPTRPGWRCAMRELKPLIGLIEPMSGPLTANGYTLR
jgi:aminoglycoside/choline kinase family phosphotransferase